MGLRPFGGADFALLSAWLAVPHVQAWWREEHDLAAVEARYRPAVDGTDPTELFIVERGAEPVGFVQRYRLDDDPAWREALAVAAVPHPAAGIDYLIGRPELIGQGLGPELIGLLVTDTWRRYPDVIAVVVDVAQQNRRSWRALERAGFVRHWAGTLVSDDPSDAGPCYVYVRRRPDDSSDR